jgi:RHS repeat-associated protein
MPRSRVTFLILLVCLLLGFCTEATNTLTYHFDYRGSTIALSADNGLVTDRIEYALYGLTTYRTGTNDTPFLFNGKYGVQTDNNGLMYMQARYYNPYLCRFISSDPSGFGGGLNTYAYANGNPVSLIDPFGLGAHESSVDLSWFNAPTAAQTQTQNIMAGFVNMATLGGANLASSAMTGNDLSGNRMNVADAYQQTLESAVFAASVLPIMAPESAALRVGGGMMQSAARTGTQLEFGFAKDFGQNSGLVIGRGRVLSAPGALGVGEYRLSWFSVQEISGMEAEWAVNQGKLQNVMKQNLPIRDASPLSDVDGFYLNRERNLLQSSDWTYKNGYWTPKP